MGLSNQRLPFRLLIVTDRHRFPDPFNWTDHLLSVVPLTPPQLLGVWVREKDLSAGELWKGCQRIVPEFRDRGVVTIVSSRADIGDECGTWGVQVGWDAAPPERIRRSFPSLAVGQSCHDPDIVAEIADATVAGCHYVVVSPIFPTPKPYPRPYLGVGGLERTATEAKVPLVALGGIHEGNIRSVLGAGADAVACMGAIWSQRRPGSVISALIEQCLR